VDPLAGSYYVEALTSQIEQRAMELLQQVETVGGAVAAVEKGFFQEEIARSAFAQQMRVESGEVVVVGVNRFTDAEAAPELAAPDYRALEMDQRAGLSRVKAGRDTRAAVAALDAVGVRAQDYTAGLDGMMGLIIAAVRARCTVGEISSALKAHWGAHKPG
jgi:methylmalonyl-CoA mutase N-terminal domain/subunit